MVSLSTHETFNKIAVSSPQSKCHEIANNQSNNEYVLGAQWN